MLILVPCTHPRWFDHVSNWSYCTYSDSTHHWYHCMPSSGSVRSRGSYEQWYSCLWRLGLRLSLSHWNPPSRWSEETTWSPLPGVASTDWRRLCGSHSTCPTSRDRLDRCYGPPMSMHSEGRHLNSRHFTVQLWIWFQDAVKAFLFNTCVYPADWLLCIASVATWTPLYKWDYYNYYYYYYSLVAH